MVPEGVNKFKVYEYGYSSTHLLMEDLTDLVLPQGNWQLLGISTELTEEQWRDLVSFHIFAYKDYKTTAIYKFKTAKESGLSLLEANGCFSVNPYGDMPPDETSTPLSWNSEGLEADIKKWQQAQENTGPRLILKKKEQNDGD